MSDEEDFTLQGSAKATIDELGVLHGVLAQVLTEEVKGHRDSKTGVVTRNAAMINAARQFLKDNGIEATAESKPLRELLEALPFDEVLVPFKNHG